MKNFRRIFAVSAMFFAAASLLSAQGLRESIQENPAYYCANHASYLFKDVVDTPAPEGYVPFYISHMARHGSRFDGGNSSVEKALKYLNVLDGAGMLTKEGKKLLELENLYYTLQKDNVGMLTSVGRYEHRTLGERMYKRFNEVFTNPERPNVDAVSTTVIRSITSMSSCTQALRSKSGKSDMPLHLSMRYGTDTDSVLFKAGDYDASMRLFSSFSDSIKVNNDGHVFLSRIIRNPAKAEKKFGNNRKLVEAVAKTLSFYGPAAIPEMNPSLWLTVDEMSEFGKHSNAAVYCYARQHYADGLPKTASFLRYLIAQADEAIAGNGICANLRFAHDTQMGVVLSLMGVEGMNGVYKADEIDKYFCSGLKIPMAVNFEVVFYKNDKGDVLVKILHNEEEKTLVGLEPFAGPYYRWNDVKAYWEGRCNGSIPVEIRK